MEWYVIGLLMVGFLILLSLMDVPIAVCLGLTAFVALAASVGLERAGHALITQIMSMWTSYTMLAIPIFIFMAEFLCAGGVSEKIFDMASKWLSGLPGGLALATIAACAIFGAMSGVTLGAVATFGVVAIPEMLKKGYSKRLACGSVTSAGNLAHLIPPSVLAVLYASVVETSPGQQLMAGLFPGIVLAIAFGLLVMVWVWLKPDAAPREPGASWKERFFVLKKMGGPLVIVVAVLGGIYTGMTTVTEASALGAFAGVLLSFASGRLTWRTFFDILLKTVKSTSFILFIAVAGKFFGWVLNYFTIPQQIVNMMVATGFDRWILMAMIQVLFIIMGMFIDPVGIMFTTVPILQPLIVAFKFDLVWFGVLFLVNMELANVTPPLGLALYVTKGIVGEQVSLRDIIQGSLTFCLATLVVIALIMAFPEIALWLPAKMR